MLWTLFTPVVVNAEEKTPADNNIVNTNAEVTKKSPMPAMPAMKTLLADGETITQGNYITLTRPVGAWILTCDLDLDHNRRLCVIKRTIKIGEEDLRLTFQTTKDEKPFFNIETTAKIDAVNGLHMGFSGLEKVLRNNVDLTCNDHKCEGGFELTGVVGAAIMAANSLTFFYVDKDNAVKNGEITMTGVREAMELAGSNPYAPIEKKKLVNQATDEKKPANNTEEKKTKKPAIKHQPKRTGNSSSLY